MGGGFQLSRVAARLCCGSGVAVTCFASHEDIGVHFMLDPRFEEDTLFMVFEEDYRFEREDPGWTGAVLASSASEPAAGARGATPRDRVQLRMANKDPAACIRMLPLGWFSAADRPAHVVRQRQRMRMRRQRMHMRVRWCFLHSEACGRTPLLRQWRCGHMPSFRRGHRSPLHAGLKVRGGHLVPRPARTWTKTPARRRPARSRTPDMCIISVCCVSNSPEHG